MLSLTRKADYALVALVFLGHRWREGESATSARQVAETFGLPQPVLMNTLKALARHGLVRSQRGVGGGYELARDPARIDLLEAVHAVEGPGEGEAADDEWGADPTTPGGAVVRRLEHRLQGFLEGLTIANLLDEPTPSAGQPGFVPLRTGSME
ncbi:MAG: RrF2 family transcriptional regulator [Phycisphaeraceae bacterium]